MGEPASDVTTRLLASPEPAVRLRVLLGVLARDPRSAEVARVRRSVRTSARAVALLSERTADGRIPFHPYRAKWYGAHWVLVALAEMGYPPGDPTLLPLRDQALEWLFAPEYARLMRTVRGLPLLHASIDGNAIYAMLALGIADDRVEALVGRLLRAQWPDGGWNCDRTASGRSSSFTESLIPLRALVRYGAERGDNEARAAAHSAREFFLRHRLFRRCRDGSVISPSFVQLHYPCYWHYDVLFGLTVMVEAGAIGDPRCTDALDVLRRKRLPDGGYPAEHRFYRPTRRMVPSQRSLVDWGPTSTHRANEFVTAHALAVLRAADQSVVT